MKQFDLYEFIGVIVPGSIVGVLIVLEVDTFRSLLGADGMSLGGAGFFLIAAFVLGQFVQSLGNVVEQIVWQFGGWPTDRVRSSQQALISSKQREQLESMVASMEDTSQSLKDYTPQDWKAVTARIAARVRGAAKPNQVELANRNYGLFRGIAAAMLLIIAWHVTSVDRDWSVLTLLILLLIAAVARMRRFGNLYARNLYLAFLDIETSDNR